MTLATKSDGLILKDGRIATNCACCDPCATKCGGSGAPGELAVTITGVTFRGDSIYDENDLPFSIPETFLVPRVGAGCSQWSALFFPRAGFPQVFCVPCTSFATSHELGFFVSEEGGSLFVQVFFTSGPPGPFNVCLGPSNRFEKSTDVLPVPPQTPICTLPFSDTIVSSSVLCPLQSVSFTIEPA
jgi:hypothetical protein